MPLLSLLGDTKSHKSNPSEIEQSPTICFHHQPEEPLERLQHLATTDNRYFVPITHFSKNTKLLQRLYLRRSFLGVGPKTSTNVSLSGISNRITLVVVGNSPIYASDRLHISI